MPFTQAPVLPDPLDPGSFNQRALAAWAWLATLATELSNALPADSAAALALSLSSAADAAKGAALLGYGPALSYPSGSVGSRLRAYVRPQEYGGKPGGVIDATAAIQAALNSGQPVVIDEPFLTSGNEVPSGCHITFRGRGKLKLASGANRPVLQNTNWNKAGWGGATYGVDSDITIDGLSIDGNQAGQVHHTTSGPYSGEYVSGVRFWGVTNLTLRRSKIYQARTFGIWIAAVDGLTVDGLVLDQYMGGTPDNQDGLHINGPARRLDIRNVRGTTNDDMVALNADDGALGANVTAGPITDAVIDGVYPAGCLNGIRLLSATSRMDRITVRNVAGTTRDVAVNQSPFGLGAGNVGTLTIENIDVACSNGYAGGDYYAVIALGGVIDQVTVRNVKRNRAADNRPTILLASDANIGVCEIAGLHTLTTTGAPLNEQAITVNGLVDTLRINGLSFFRDSLLAPDGAVLWINAASGKGVNNLICSDWVTQRLEDVISLTSGKLVNVQLSNILDTAGSAGYSLLNLASATGGATALSTFNARTDTGRQIVKLGGASSLSTAVTIDSAGLSGAEAGLTSNQSVTSAAYRKMVLSSLNFDRLGEFSTTNRRFTVTQGDGTYSVSYALQATIPTNPTDVTVALYKNGVMLKALPGSQRYFADAVIGGHTTVSVVAGDYLEVFIFCSANITLIAGDSTFVRFERLK